MIKLVSLKHFTSTWYLVDIIVINNQHHLVPSSTGKGQSRGRRGPLSEKRVKGNGDSH